MSSTPDTVPSAAEFEKLGMFYLGRELPSLDADSDDQSPTRTLLYDSRDLVTHALCVGMTGSGKTGLCMCLLEEAAIDGIPAIVIDPKGDLSNLLLTFPELQPEDFRPWINADDARRKGVSQDEYAKKQADLWKNGLGKWGQDGERIKRLRDAADFMVYTPGSSSGMPVSVLRSFDPPTRAVIEDADLYRAKVSGAVSSLLGLLKVESDPVTGPEHIFLSALLDHEWQHGRTITLAGLIRAIQQPPISRVGVMDLEMFFPEKDRVSLAMKLNALVASPAFAAWSEGPALDIANALYTPEGKPRIAIFSIAHLNDDERMFFVSTLLQRVLEWTRSQPGTTSLRALVYMDEIAGYCPPVANPPSKQPLLTLMKQARAFGVGIVLATQNPVDLDYKGLSNAGTWLIGRLQAERDKQRLLDGLESAAGGSLDRSAIDKAISGLRSRVFLMNNVHDDGPVLFETRWAMSYLRGPLTRDQIGTLMESKKQALQQAKPVIQPPSQPAVESSHSDSNQKENTDKDITLPPVLPSEVSQFFVGSRSRKPAKAELTYVPSVIGSIGVHYSDARRKVDYADRIMMLVPMQDGPVPVDFDHAAHIELTEDDLTHEPDEKTTFQSFPSGIIDKSSERDWKKQFTDTIYRNQRLTIFTSKSLKLISEPDESEAAFQARLSLAAREKRDELSDELRGKYGPKLDALEERLRKAEQKIEVQKSQARGATMSAVISAGAAVLGAFLGRKKISSSTVTKAGTAVRGASRSAQEAGDVKRAREDAEAIKAKLEELEAEFKEELKNVEQVVETLVQEVDRIEIAPKKTNIDVRIAALCWLAHWKLPDGTLQEAWT
ncbi:MAG: ATP-binding protein [Phycisphaeraceae bacterium]|nr:ATP-binding protein [Phycisphaerales bacterium]MCB9861685.1 ATP-binding protein [Phycisphaeraceae bacterium]